MYDTNTTQQKPDTKKRRSHSEWRALVEEHKNSGLSVTAFCQKHHLAESGFYTWRKKFSVDEQTVLTDAVIELTNSPLENNHKRLDSNWQVELELAAGFVLRINTH